MQSAKLLFFSVVILSAIGLQGQQKTFDWIPQNTDTFRIGPGYHNGIAVYNPHGWEAIHVRLDIASRAPVSIGVVRLEDWNNAIHNPELLAKLNYDCLNEGVTRISYSCDFSAGFTSRVVVVRDTRRGEKSVATGVAAPLVRYGMNEFYANDIHVTPYRWGCTSNCDLPDPPQFAWVNLRKEKYEISGTFKSYGPFAAERESYKVRIHIKAQVPMTAAMVSSNMADELYAHLDQARDILSKSTCKQYGVQSSTFECTLQKDDGVMQVVLLPEVEVKKKKKAEIEISTIQCVANCVAAKE